MTGPAGRFPKVNGVLSYFARHATAANLLLVLIVAMGLAAIPNLRAQYFPDVVTQDIVVRTYWNGAGPEDVDRGIVQLMEPALRAVEGVDHVTAISREGRAVITMDFGPGEDMSRALDDVEKAVAGVTNLPADAEKPVVVQSGWRDRVTDMVITGPVEPAQLLRLADEFLSRLFEAGVTRATIEGIANPEVQIEVPLAQLMRHGLTLTEIGQRVGAEVATDPAGEVTGSSSRLRAGTERRSPDALGQIVLRSGQDGTDLRLGDIATITERGSSAIHAYYVGENPAITLRADRDANGDALALQAKVEEVAAELRPTLPNGVKIDMIRVRSDEIRARLDILVANGLMGLALVVVTLFLFLNARTAFWVAAGIPVSMLIAVAMMQAFGMTINMISLFALILTMGIVVDDAIVVGEHTDFRTRRLNEPPEVAAENAVSRMAAPVLASSLTTIAAFLGLTALTGRFGHILQDIPFTVTVVLTASLLECFLILPNHMSHRRPKDQHGHWLDAPSRYVNRGFGRVRDHLVRPLTRWVIWARYPVCAAAIVLLAWQVGAFIKGDVKWRFFASPEQGTIDGNFAMLPGATRADTFAMMKALQASVDKVAAEYRTKYGVEPLSYVIAEIGANAGRGLAVAETKDADLLGAVSIELTDPDLRPWSASDFISSLQDAAPLNPLVEQLSFRGGHFGPSGDAISVELSGADAAILKAAAEGLKRALVVFPEVSALEDTLPYDKDEMILNLTPQGRALGFTVDALGAEMRNRLNGLEAASFPDGSRSTKVMVQLPEHELTADFLARSLMRTQSGGYVPLADLVTVERKQGFSTVRRENGKRVITVRGDVADDNPSRAEEIRSRIETEILPGIAADYGVAYGVAGLNEQEADFLDEAAIGLMLALIGIYAIMAWIFASWTRPIVVMLVIPLGLIGALYGHGAWNVPVSMFSIVGIIGMCGIIVNDAIVLVSTVDEYAEKRGLIPATIDAVADRLRPVFLTTATTVVGMAPLLFETSRQAEFLKPTVITLCYGLGVGMVLVLLVVPAMVIIQHDLGQRLRAYRRARRAPHMARLVFSCALTMAGIFAATLGVAIWQEAALLPAFGYFVAGEALVCAIFWLIGRGYLRRAQPAQP
ncbi:MAG TPA: efflux RND transporter permease subunit [Albidovulum sp.]|uniref:efflux RND transporter permease subunit n=1 Tax=Albidovulum sp. TaxID=1872424 RepID=UPI002C496608|nr:efflux RND transporter permease subunit [Albidovulum sp.]